MAGFIAAAVLLGLWALAPLAGAQADTGNAALSAPLSSEGRAQEEALASDLKLSDAQATRDIQVQKAVGNLNVAIEEALGDSYAEVWFDPWHGRFDIGVAPSTQASLEKAKAIVTKNGLDSVTSYVPVRSTHHELLSARKDWLSRSHALMQKQQAETMIDAANNAVLVKVSDTANTSERQALQQAATSDSVNVRVETVPADRLQPKASSLGECVFEAKVSDFCNPPLVGGTGIFSEGWIEHGEPFYEHCTGAFMGESKLPEMYPDHYLLTAGHCFERNETTLNGKWYSANAENVGKTIGKMDYRYVNGEGDAAFINMNANTTYWKTGNHVEWWPYVYTPEQKWGPSFAEEDYPINQVGTNDPPNVQYQVPCHIGWSSGVHCGVTEHTEVTAPITYEVGVIEVGNLVDNTACATPGDSGGPWVMNNYAMGIMVGITGGSCPSGTSLFDDEHTLDKNLGIRIVGWNGSEE